VPQKLHFAKSLENRAKQCKNLVFSGLCEAEALFIRSIAHHFAHTHRLFRHHPKTAANMFAKNAKKFSQFSPMKKRTEKPPVVARNNIDLWWANIFFLFFLCWRERSSPTTLQNEKIALWVSKFHKNRTVGFKISQKCGSC
jgi:hypothetical protein